MSHRGARFRLLGAVFELVESFSIGVKFPGFKDCWIAGFMAMRQAGAKHWSFLLSPIPYLSRFPD